MKRIIIATLLLAGTVAGCGGSSPTGYHDMKRLQADIRSRLWDPVIAEEVSQTSNVAQYRVDITVDCHPSGANQAGCRAWVSGLPNGDQILHIPVQISTNGQEYIASGMPQ